MSEKIDYSKYECPYSHLEKECGHELHSPEGYQDIYSVWCQCGFRAPVFYLDPVVLGLKLKGSNNDGKSLVLLTKAHEEFVQCGIESEIVQEIEEYLKTK